MIFLLALAVWAAACTNQEIVQRTPTNEIATRAGVMTPGGSELRDSLCAMDYYSMVIAFSELSPEQKRDVWLSKMYHILAVQSLTQAQTDFVNMLIDSLDAEMYNDTYTAAEDSVTEANYAEAQTLFTDIEIWKFFGWPCDIGQGPVGPDGPIITNCTCRWSLGCTSMFLGLCDTEVDCLEAGTRYCGFLWLQRCNGICDEDIHHHPNPTN